MPHLPAVRDAQAKCQLAKAIQVAFASILEPWPCEDEDQLRSPQTSTRNDLVAELGVGFGPVVRVDVNHVRVPKTKARVGSDARTEMRHSAGRCDINP